MKKSLIPFIMLFALTAHAQKWHKTGWVYPYKNGTMWRFSMGNQPSTDTIAVEYTNGASVPEKSELDTVSCACTYFTLPDENGFEVYYSCAGLKQIVPAIETYYEVRYDIVFKGKTIKQIPEKIVYTAGASVINAAPDYLYKGKHITPIRLISRPINN